jgi:hypothetical protein
VDGTLRRPEDVYRVIGAAKSTVLTASEEELVMNEEYGSE